MIMIDNELIVQTIQTFVDRTEAGEQLFDYDDLERQATTIHEDDSLRLTLILTKVQKRNASRWVYSYIEFKKFDDVTKSGAGFKMDDFEIPLHDQLRSAKTSLYNLIVLAFQSCSIKNHKNIEFDVNGYKLEIVKVSAKYITIAEHINAVRFEKRFSKLDKMFRYIDFRKYFHESINISVSVPEHELKKLEIEKGVLQRNVDRVYEELMLKLTSSLTDAKLATSYSISNVFKSEHDIVNFDVSMLKESVVQNTMHVSYSDIAGVSICDAAHIHKDIYTSEEIKTMANMFTVISRIEQTSGYFKRFVELETQLKKFKIKTATTGSNVEIEQKPVYLIASQIFDKLRQAKDDLDMTTDPIELTPVGQYKRWVQLEGAMKNRRRCNMVIYASDGISSLEEYRATVEKERIADDATQFFGSYFA